MSIGEIVVAVPNKVWRGVSARDREMEYHAACRSFKSHCRSESNPWYIEQWFLSLEKPKPAKNVCWARAAQVFVCRHTVQFILLLSQHTIDCFDFENRETMHRTESIN